MTDNRAQALAALSLAARAVVTHLYQMHYCPHDFEGHDFMAIEEYLVRRWLRGPSNG